MKTILLIIIFAILLRKGYFAWLRGWHTYQADRTAHDSLHEYLLAGGATKWQARRPFLRHAAVRSLRPLARQWWLLVLIVVAVVLLAACSRADSQPATNQTAEPIDTLPTMIMQIQRCSRLYTTEVRVHKIVTYDDVVRLRGSVMDRAFDIPLPLGERKVAIPMDATLKAYVDMSQITAKNIERDGQRITILLPDPKVVLTSSRIDQKGVREYVAITRSRFSDRELSDYEQQGREAILRSIGDMNIQETARENAARVLVPLVAQMGFREEDITIAFRHDMELGVERLKE
ncbi:MAG: DUF4230 domain-containing protein [Prevotella sp.]|nr:DUF4230 domain-containing protein [Prevotella sp.]